MRNFMQHYRNANLLVVIVIITILIVAIGYNFISKNCELSTTSNTVIPVKSDTANNKTTGIVRTGTVEYAVTVPITSGYSGRISDVYVKEGAAVKAGQALFKLMPTASGAETAANPPGSNKAGKSAPAQNDYDSLQKEYTRLKQLYELGAIPRREVEQAAARLQAAKTGANNGQSSSSAASSSPKIVGPVLISAPVSGIVSNLVPTGSTVQAGQQVMVLGTGQKVEIVVKLEQKELYLVHLGTAAFVSIVGQTFNGHVASIFPKVQDNKIVSFLAHINLVSSSELLKAGMTVNVHIDTGK